MLSGLTACEHLSLSSNVIDKMASLGGMANLRSLSLGRNKIKKVSATCPGLSATCPGLLARSLARSLARLLACSLARAPQLARSRARASLPGVDGLLS